MRSPDTYYIEWVDESGYIQKSEGIWDDPIAAASHMLSVSTPHDYTLRRVSDQSQIFVAPANKWSVYGFPCRDIVWVNVSDWSKDE